ncbi:DUF1214 domain-containing protein [Candidatus Marimicrobium litorale]|uniref:DUF1214 domain-containing protein n=1 Tax=Candidatus Marimicrobium litorale TaxID=2518991 RepID=A0ABT3T5J5_9GAMM|nr:DUF1214 domain-containing protein [Candidatus Marimicrobium litorale]MCX2977105.1 DUF1214 domain-containing protein [Candidatus Marimicrobium litorale]
MLRSSLIALACIAIGLYAGYQLPRGAGLITALSNLAAGENEHDYTALASHQALLDFQSSVDGAREMVLTDARSKQEAIEGMRWLLRVAAMSTHIIADANPNAPRFQRMDTWVRKAGGDNPDAEYYLAAIDGSNDYRITGNLGTVQHLSFTINAGQGMERRRQVGYVNEKDLTTDEDGNFTLLLHKSKPNADNKASDWLQIPKDTSAILVRAYIADRDTERLPQLDIEVEGGNPPYQPPSDKTIADAITGTSFAFFVLTNLHRTVLPELMETTNTFIRATPERLGKDIAASDNLYMLGSFQLEPDEALMIRVQPPATRYWNLTLETRWHEIYDYLSRPTSRTLADVTPSPDGSVEFLVSHQDTGHPNWLDTSGHAFGFLTLRWLDVDHADVPMPELELVKLSSLAQVTGSAAPR